MSNTTRAVGVSTNRRGFLKVAGAGLAGLATTRSLLTAAVAAEQEGPYGPFKMGIQSYSLRNYKVDEAMEWTRKLGLTYWESYNGHLPLTDDSGKIAGYKEKLASAGIQIMAYGVVGFGADKAKNRAVFEFAKAMGIAVLSADPKPEAFDDLDQLVEEFGIHIAIHNHGPGHPYDKIKNVEDAIKGRHERIGSCVDTGHYLRSKEDPVDAIRRLGKRVYAVHLKDVRSAKTFTVVGDGDLDVPGVLRELKKLKYSQCLALEYEENPDNPIADIRRSLAHVQKAVKKVAGK